MPKLSDAQLVLLSAAAARPDRAILPPPPSLILNKAALARAIESLLSRVLIAERPATHADTIWREDGDQRLALVITASGLDALGITDGEPMPQAAAGDPEPLADASRPVRSKAEAVLALLRLPEGASIADMNAATDWQAHSIRAFLSGLRKKGAEVVRTKDDAGKAIYRVMESVETAA